MSEFNAKQERLLIDNLVKTSALTGNFSSIINETWCKMTPSQQSAVASVDENTWYSHYSDTVFETDGTGKIAALGWKAWSASETPDLTFPVSCDKK